MLPWDEGGRSPGSLAYKPGFEIPKRGTKPEAALRTAGVVSDRSKKRLLSEKSTKTANPPHTHIPRKKDPHPEHRGHGLGPQAAISYCFWVISFSGKRHHARKSAWREAARCRHRVAEVPHQRTAAGDWIRRRCPPWSTWICQACEQIRPGPRDHGRPWQTAVPRC